MRTTPTITDRIGDATFRGIVRVAMAMPYERRVAFLGGVVSRILGPPLGYSKRIRENLSLVMPNLDELQIQKIIRGSTNNMGRTLAEMYSGEEFISRCAETEITGPGLAILDKAHADGNSVVLITGHFGNYDVPRAALIRRGFKIAALYRPMNNSLFNEHYLEAMKRIGPAFPRSKGGTTGLVRHLKKGGMAELLIDQHFRAGVDLKFFGHKAVTSVVPAQLALKYDAPLVPMYGIRKADGINFDIVVEDPIEPSDPETMTQALNDSLEVRTRKNMEQWLWVHRRWRD